MQAVKEQLATPAAAAAATMATLATQRQPQKGRSLHIAPASTVPVQQDQVRSAFSPPHPGLNRALGHLVAGHAVVPEVAGLNPASSPSATKTKSNTRRGSARGVTSVNLPASQPQNPQTQQTFKVSQEDVLNTLNVLRGPAERAFTVPAALLQRFAAQASSWSEPQDGSTRSARGPAARPLPSQSDSDSGPTTSSSSNSWPSMVGQPPQLRSARNWISTCMGSETRRGDLFRLIDLVASERLLNASNQDVQTAINMHFSGLPCIVPFTLESVKTGMRKVRQLVKVVETQVKELSSATRQIPMKQLAKNLWDIPSNDTNAVRKCAAEHGVYVHGYELVEKLLLLAELPKDPMPAVPDATAGRLAAPTGISPSPVVNGGASSMPHTLPFGSVAQGAHALCTDPALAHLFSPYQTFAGQPQPIWSPMNGISNIEFPGTVVPSNIVEFRFAQMESQVSQVRYEMHFALAQMERRIVEHLTHHQLGRGVQLGSQAAAGHSFPPLQGQAFAAQQHAVPHPMSANFPQQPTTQLTGQPQGQGSSAHAAV